MKSSAYTLTLLVLLATHSSLAAYSIGNDFEISPPPGPGSAKYKQDFTELHQWQNSRSREDCEIADTQSRMDLNSFFGPMTGILASSEMNAVRAILTEVKATVSKTVDPFKEDYARPRPYNVDSTLKPCIYKPGGERAYPSGHAAMGITLSRVLVELFPEKKEMLLEQGIQIGMNRVLGGVHHPSDVKAGQNLGDDIFLALKRNAKFKTDLAEAKSHLR